MTPNSALVNSHLDSSTFFWRAGKTGALLIHGFIATTATMRGLGESLHARGYTVLAPLLPGHGTAPADLNRQRWQDWTNAVTLAYHELASQCDLVFVCGSSMGGLLSLYLASEQPVTGLCLYAPAVKTPAPRQLVARALAPFIPYLTNPVSPANDVTARWSGYAVTPLRAVVELGKLQRETRRRLSRLHQPMMILLGRHDRQIDPRSGEIIIAETHAADKELHWLENSGHSLPIDQDRERVAQLTAQFIERHSTRSP
jgi:carboxylesterase